MIRFEENNNNIIVTIDNNRLVMPANTSFYDVLRNMGTYAQASHNSRLNSMLCDLCGDYCFHRKTKEECVLCMTK